MEFLLDGAPNNTIYNGVTTVANVPSVDAVQEFKVMTSTYDAQYGHTGGGAINISLKSGTNSLHGSGYEYLKRQRFNAAAFSDNAHGNAVPSSGLDQYGFTIGGPVRVPKVYNGKDKTFFFFALEKYHEDQEYPAEKVASVPTAAQRAGDFSKTLRQLRPPDHAFTIPLTGKADATGKVDPAAVSGQHDSCRPDQSGGRQDSGALSAAEHGFGRIARVAEQLLLGGQRGQFQLQQRDVACGSQLSTPRSGFTRAGPGATSRRSGPRMRFRAWAATIATAASYSNGGVIDSVTTLELEHAAQYARVALLLDGN